MPSLTTVGRIGVVWVPSLLLAFIFLMAGVPKLTGAEGHIRHFEVWRYPDWFRLVVGAIETTSAILLLVPRLAAGRRPGHRRHHGRGDLHARDPRAGRAPFTLSLLALALFVAYCRRPRRLRAVS